MSFTEANTVEAYVRDLLSGPVKAVPANVAQEPQASYGTSPKGIGWRYKAPADVPRQIQWVFRFIVTAHSGIVTRDSGDRDRG